MGRSWEHSRGTCGQEPVCAACFPWTGPSSAALMVSLGCDGQAWGSISGQKTTRLPSAFRPQSTPGRFCSPRAGQGSAHAVIKAAPEVTSAPGERPSPVVKHHHGGSPRPEPPEYQEGVASPRGGVGGFWAGPGREFQLTCTTVIWPRVLSVKKQLSRDFYRLLHLSHHALQSGSYEHAPRHRLLRRCLYAYFRFQNLSL